MSDENPLAASLGAMNDPQVRAQIQRQLDAYEPVLDRLDALLRSDDPVAVDYLKDIACFVCGLTARLGVEFDPGLNLLLLQRVGHMMADSPERWQRYTAEVAPGANANRARGRSAGLPTA